MLSDVDLDARRVKVRFNLERVPGQPWRIVEILGHRHPSVTRRYKHVLDSMLDDAARLEHVFPTVRKAV